MANDTVVAHRRVAVIGGGPSGLTTALLLARAGHRVVIHERERELGGLWATRLDENGHYRGENSCKVYQSTYRTAPAALRLVGTRWEQHFTPRHDLRTQWLHPFLKDCSPSDLAKLGRAFFAFWLGFRTWRNVSVREYVQRSGISEACQRWLRATALGGVTGTLDMTMWELFYRFRGNLRSVLLGEDGALHWNAQPPNSPEGFVTAWKAELDRLGVEVRVGGVKALARAHGGVSVDGHLYDAAFLAVPPPAMARLLLPSEFAGAFGRGAADLERVLAESVYEHLGLAWFFDRPFPNDLPLGGHNVRRGWHPILVQHSQYERYLRPPAVTAVVGSVSLVTEFRHDRLGTRVGEHTVEELARILWEDERRADPTLPEPIDWENFGTSSATQIVRHGPLPIRADDAELYIATHLNGHAPYFTASLESAVQAGAAAAAAFDAAVERLPVGSGGRVAYPNSTPPRSTSANTSSSSGSLT